jgi:hypothetical protein
VSFGLMTYHTVNLGDEIQSIAAARFLPRVDVLVRRDAIDDEPDGSGPVHTILNGWFLERPEHWPPHPRIKPLLVSMHLNSRLVRKRFWRRTAATRMLTRAGRDWLIAHGPVGARDRATHALLERSGVPAWHSGCLTLTLPAATATRDDLVVACDLPAPYVEAMRTRTRSAVVPVTHYDATTVGHEPRLAKAQALLDLYARARAVVTSRLHCALPCLALGTPVLFVPVDLERKRQQPAFEFAHFAMPADFLAGRYDFDLDAPPANPDGWRPFAQTLAVRCTAFSAGVPEPAP